MVDELARSLITGMTAFAATNIDDIVILMLFFAQVNADFRPKHIVVGQYLGFSVLVAASFPGFLGGLLIPKAWIGLLGFVPIAIGIYHLFKAEKDESVQTVPHQVQNLPSKRSMVASMTNLLPAQTYHVAAITLANGGDNIGIYVPLFASSNLISLVIILSVFFLLIGVWCYAAYQLTRHATIAHILTRYGQAIVPFVLIGLGGFILLESGTFQLLSIS